MGESGCARSSFAKATENRTVPHSRLTSSAQRGTALGHQVSTGFSGMNILAVAGPGSKYQVSGARWAGFLAGLWHGLICPITFIVSMFTPKVRIYETNNCGLFYDLGFLIGVSYTFGNGAHQATIRTSHP